MRFLTELYIRSKLVKIGRLAALTGHEAATLCHPEQLPKVIHIFWDQDLSKAPRVVQQCIKSWTDLNPGWKIILWNNVTAERVLPWRLLPAGSSIQTYADMFRVRVLRSQGGVWADATCYCAKPLDDWLPWIMAQSDFFAFSRPAYDRLLSNWFLVSQPNGKIISIFDDEISQYIGKLKSPPRAYTWPHYLFEAALLRRRSMRRLWDHVPSLSAAPIHLAQKLLIENHNPALRDLTILKSAPMHKLTYKKGVTDKAVSNLTHWINQ